MKTLTVSDSSVISRLGNSNVKAVITEFYITWDENSLEMETKRRARRPPDCRRGAGATVSAPIFREMAQGAQGNHEPQIGRSVYTLQYFSYCW